MAEEVRSSEKLGEDVEKFSTKIVNQMTMLKGQVVCEIKASEDGLRKWVQVVPPSPNRNGKISEQKFIMSIFELEQPAVVPQEWEFESYYLKSEITEYVNSIAEVETRLIELGYTPGLFTEPWNTDFPL